MSLILQPVNAKHISTCHLSPQEKKSNSWKYILFLHLQATGLDTYVGNFAQHSKVNAAVRIR